MACAQKERAHNEQEGKTKKREHTKNKRGKPRSSRSAEQRPEREREHTKNMRGKPKREGT